MATHYNKDMDAAQITISYEVRAPCQNTRNYPNPCTTETECNYELDSCGNMIHEPFILELFTHGNCPVLDTPGNAISTHCERRLLAALAVEIGSSNMVAGVHTPYQ